MQRYGFFRTLPNILCGFFRILMYFSTKNAVHIENLHNFAIEISIIHYYIDYEDKRTYKKQRL